MKKYLAAIMVLGFLFVCIPQTKASVLSDLINQVENLSKQINALKSQLKGQVIGASSNNYNSSNNYTVPVVASADCNLSATLDSTTPVAGSMVDPSANSIQFLRIKMKASGCDIKLTNLQIGASSINTGNFFSNIQILNNSGSVIGQANSLEKINSLYGTRYTDIWFNNPVIIANNTSQVLTVSSSLSSVATGSLSLGIVGIGHNGGLTSPFPFYGNLIKVNNSTSTSACTSTSAPSITVLSPNGGETFTAGQQITVKWSSCNIPVTKNISFSLFMEENDGSAAGSPLVFSTPNDGQEVVTLPTKQSGWSNVVPMKFV